MFQCSSEAPSLRPQRKSERLAIARRLNRMQQQSEPQTRISEAAQMAAKRSSDRSTNRKGMGPGLSCSSSPQAGVDNGGVTAREAVITVGAPGGRGVGSPVSEAVRKRPANAIALRFAKLKRKREVAEEVWKGAQSDGKAKRS
jgi:hypothetical protein